MKNYVISLNTAAVRRDHITREFADKNICFCFFDAVSPDRIAETDRLLGTAIGRAAELSDNEKACFLSHALLWHTVLQQDTEYAAVFEDDIYLGENARLFFTDSQWLQQTGIDFLKTETFLQRRKIVPLDTAVPDGRKIGRLNEYHLGTAGYIISRTAAAHLLDFVRNLPADKLLAVDQIMFEQFLLRQNHIPIHQLYPAVCIQEFILNPDPATQKLPSTIAAGRIRSKQTVKSRNKRSWRQKLKGETANLLRKTIGRLTRTAVLFR